MLYILRLLLILLLCTTNAYASWDSFIAWLKDPCNAGADDIIEHWGDNFVRSTKPNRLCPPWNKSRPDRTCLIQFDYPENFNPWYLKYCAESTSESNYFAPKIRVRYQSCNFFACWNDAKTLNWDGQCVVWPSGYAIPMLRICARVAVPAVTSSVNGADPMPADPGYTYGVHLDEQGVAVEDEEYLDSGGVPFKLISPKLCGYKDPSLLDTITTIGIAGIDFMDYNPVKQPIHNTGGLHPIAKVLIFLVEQMAGSATSLGDMVGTLFDMIGGGVIPGLDVFKKIADAIGAIIKFIADIFIAIIKEFGQFNRVVDKALGCVELPLGPFPPPFCAKILPFVPPPVTQSICEVGGQDTSGNIVLTASTQDHACVNSLLINNFIRNSVRITFDNFIPLCSSSNGQQIDPTQTDQCVVINNLDAFNSATVLHTAMSGRDIIKKCDNAPSNQPCVKTMLPEPKCTLAGDNSWCADGFRVVYASKTGKSTVPTNYFYNDLDDCDSSNASFNCQKIWGVNSGAFVDISLIFPSQEYSYNITPLSKSFSIKDTNQNSKTFNASITRQTTTRKLSDSSNFVQQPNQLCVFTSGKVVGCEERVPLQPQLKNNCTSRSSQTVDNNTLGMKASEVHTETKIASDGSTITITHVVSDDATKVTTTTTTTTCDQLINCVGSDGKLVSCNGLSSMPKVFMCDSIEASNLGFNCASSYFIPQFVLNMNSGVDSVSAQLKPSNVYDNTSNNNIINMAGYDFVGYITDDSLLQKPFPVGPNSANASSIYGKYMPGPKNNIAAPYTIDSQGKITVADGIYLSGIEYMNDSYLQGGKYACLQTATLPPCGPNNSVNCVLAKLLNNDIVNCKDFLQLNSKYLGLKSCTKVLSSITIDNNVLETVSGNKGGSIEIYKTSDQGYCYKNSLNVDEICKVSVLNSDRQSPAPNSNLFARLGDQEYYDINNSNNTQYDQNLYALRNKTPIELGLCATIPQPKCAAVNEANVQWPETDLGKEVVGTCPNLYSAAGNLKRYCTTDATNKTAIFTPLDGNSKCVYNACSAISTPGFGDGNATWNATSTGNVAEGKCLPGYSSYGAVTRGCKAGVGNNAPSWDVVTNHCVPGKIQFQNSNNIPWNGNYGVYLTFTNNSSFLSFGTRNCCSWASAWPSIYNSNTTFYIADISKVNSFYISDMWFDDYVTVKMNGTIVYNNMDRYIGDTNISSHMGVPLINLKPYLVNGMNSLSHDLTIYGGGNLYYYIVFDTQQ